MPSAEEMAAFGGEPEALEGEVVQIVFECWIVDRKGSFVKHEELSAVQEWILNTLPTLAKHEHMVVSPHEASEYNEHGSYVEESMPIGWPRPVRTGTDR